MSERKVLQKYFPPDFDPAALEKRSRGPKQTGPKVQTVRLMAPFSMKCTHCGEFIYKGRKFNARKETSDEKYLSITIFRFYIRCTRCSGEITFKTDPKNRDYECERGAKRNFEPWREAKLAEETEEEMLDRIEAEELERDAMKELETKVLDAKTEMDIADKLDEIRSRNARHEKVGKDGVKTDVPDVVDDKRKREEEEDAAAARNVFERRNMPHLGEELVHDDDEDEDMDLHMLQDASAPVFKKKLLPKKDYTAALGIKIKKDVGRTPTPVPAKVPFKPQEVKKPALLLPQYSDSDDD